MVSVQDLALNNHGIASIAIGKLPAFTALKALNLENNLVSDITPLGRLESLVQLHVACNRIKSLPKLSDGLFFQLRVLDVGFNQIPVTEVFARESDWSRLPSLRRLDMSGNHLSSLPEAIGSFPSLQQLTLEYNQLSGESLRPLGSLRKLEILGLANNHVDSIPAEAFKACSFNNLTVLDLSRNWIRYEAVANWFSCISLYFYSCTQRTCPCCGFGSDGNKIQFLGSMGLITSNRLIVSTTFWGSLLVITGSPLSTVYMLLKILTFGTFSLLVLR